MNSRKLYFILIGVITLMLVALTGGAYQINKALQTKANHLTALKAKSQALEQEQQTLVKAKKDLAKYAEVQKITEAIVPEDKSQAEAVREIVKIAGKNGVILSAINFPASSLGSLSTGGTASGTSTTPKPTVTNSKTGSLSQLLPVKNIPGVYQLTITVVGDTNRPVPYARLVAFLKDLEHNRRTAQVSTITIQPDNNNRSLLSFTLGLNEYIKP